VSSSAPGAEDLDTVRGERSTALVHAVRSVQARVSNVLAAGLMMALGLSGLVWYYAHAWSSHTHARQAAQSNSLVRAQAEMPLPPLGPIGSPVPTAAPAPDLPLEAAKVRPAVVPGATAATQDAPAEAPVRPASSFGGRASRRRLSGVVFARESQSAAAAPPSTPVPSADVNRPAEPSEGGIAPLLRPSLTPAAEAQRPQAARFLLPKGAFIDCTLETAIDSTLPGMTTCITAADTFGADGKVVLLERGTKLIGETRGQVQQGQARVFVVWTQARTPSGVTVPLDSPGTDELGRAGLPGQVERHFWERFGAALLVSLIDGAVQAAVQASARTGGTVIYAPSGAQQVLSEVLKDTLRIAPTVIKRNGDRIQVLVARDLDFRLVYELRAADR
jgi:type IV secretion system protein VirB10